MKNVFAIMAYLAAVLACPGTGREVARASRVDAFARTRAKAVGSVGSFERMAVLPARQSGDYTVVDVLLTSAAGDAVFDRDGRVAGLALEYPYPRCPGSQPGGMADLWS